MKKLGFTLAEVMVALALIGTITALTIPTFVSSNKNRTHSAKVGITVSAVENAFSSMIAAEAAQNLSETRFGRDDGQTAPNLSQYIKLLGSGSLADYYTNAAPFQTLNGEETGADVTSVFETKNGALLLFTSTGPHENFNPADATVDGSIGRLIIDVNGGNPPNIMGRDAFFFRIGTDGFLYPAGSLNFSLLEEANKDNTWKLEGSKYICTDDNKGLGCTARLIENNYEVDY